MKCLKIIRNDSFSNLVNVQSHITKLLLDLPNDVKVGSAVKGVSPQQQQLNKILGDVSSCHVQPTNKLRWYKTVPHRYNMGDSVTGIYNDSGKQSLQMKQ